MGIGYDKNIFVDDFGHAPSCARVGLYVQSFFDEGSKKGFPLLSLMQKKKTIVPLFWEVIY
ncbi:hypothetical protein ASE74_03545 [Pedobacter sp. Leaf216]|nr:hypothetical protein ASE74_03545 [Pedobacter sp. Leaf216]